MLACILFYDPGVSEDVVRLASVQATEYLYLADTDDAPRVLALPEGIRVEFIELPRGKDDDQSQSDLHELNLPTRAHAAIVSQGIATISALAKKSDRQLRGIPGVGVALRRQIMQRIEQWKHAQTAAEKSA